MMPTITYLATRYLMIGPHGIFSKLKGPWLNEGDVVELEIEQIGILKNTIGKIGEVNEKNRFT